MASKVPSENPVPYSDETFKRIGPGGNSPTNRPAPAKKGEFVAGDQRGFGKVGSLKNSPGRRDDSYVPGGES